MLGRECHCGLWTEEPAHSSHLLKMVSSKTTYPVLIFNSLWLAYTNKPPLRNGKYKDGLSCTSLQFSLASQPTKASHLLKMGSAKMTCPVLIFNSLWQTTQTSHLLKIGKYKDDLSCTHFNSLWLAYKNKPPLKNGKCKDDMSCSHLQFSLASLQKQATF